MKAGQRAKTTRRKSSKTFTVQRKIESVRWFRFAQRESIDFPLLIVDYFLEGHKQRGIKHLLYLNKYPDVYGYKDQDELGKIYQKIKKYKKDRLKAIAGKVEIATKNTTKVLVKITPRNLKKLNNLELRNEFSHLSRILCEFLGYFVYIQYMGYALKDDKSLLRNFNKKILLAIRHNFFISRIQDKLKIIFSEISKRKSIKSDLLFWSFHKEIKKLLVTKNEDYSFKLEKELKKRKKFYLWVLLENKHFFYTNREGERIANNILKQSTEATKTNLIKGQVTHKGKVRGIAKIILSKKDFKNIEKGNILVAIMTMPYYLPIFRKAGAVVTDEGGLLSHASIIARELKKPCVIGTKIATKVLKDGDLVEVDANKGVVKILKKK